MHELDHGKEGGSPFPPIELHEACMPASGAVVNAIACSGNKGRVPAIGGGSGGQYNGLIDRSPLVLSI